MLGGRPSLNDLVRSQQQRLWDGQTERPRCFQIDDQLEARRLLVIRDVVIRDVVDSVDFWSFCPCDRLGNPRRRDPELPRRLGEGEAESGDQSHRQAAPHGRDPAAAPHPELFEPEGRPAAAHERLRLPVLVIGHDRSALQSAEDDVVQGARSEIPVEGRNRRFRTKCASPDNSRTDP